MLLIHKAAFNPYIDLHINANNVAFSVSIII